MSDLVLVTGEHDASVRQRALEAGRGLDVRFVSSSDELDELLPSAVAVAGSLDGSRLARGTALRWVHSWRAGVDADLDSSMLSSGVTLTSSAGNGAVPLAEHAIMMMLMLDRSADAWVRAQQARRWERSTHGELTGRVLGLYGVGNAGRDLALKAKAFHMTVLGCRAEPSRSAPGVDEMYGPDELLELLPRCDFVVVTAPLTKRTRAAFGRAAFAAMRPSAFWICVSRGGIADDTALERALRENWIAGAGLDAHGQEPLPPDSPFWDLPNVLITPHNGATTQGTAARGTEIFLDNLDRFSRGATLTNVVDKERGY